MRKYIYGSGIFIVRTCTAICNSSKLILFTNPNKNLISYCMHLYIEVGLQVLDTMGLGITTSHDFDGDIAFA